MLPPSRLMGSPSTLLFVALASASAPAEAPPALDLDPRKRLTAEDEARKNEGWYVTGLPLVAYDPNAGYGAGARAYYYFNGWRDDALFGYTPYLHRVFLQGFVTTRGLQFHWLDYDAPYLFGTPYRVRGQLLFERNLNRYYYGTGARSLEALVSPANGRRYRSIDRYDESLATIGPGGQTWVDYDKTAMTRPFLLLSVERTFWRGTLRPLLGLGFSHTTIHDYTGAQLEVGGGGSPGRAVEAETRLRADCAAGLVNGCGGGWDNILRLGLSFDTRDFEPDPNRGVFFDLGVDIGTRLLGSQFDYVRALASARVYYSPIPEWADLVLAARGTYQVQSKGTPFFSMNLMPFTEDPRVGLGGLRTMRGFRQDRFVGPVMALVNVEARWTFMHGELFDQKLALIFAPFVDSGRVFDHVGDTSLADWQPAYGATLRIAWNQATIIMLDYGRSHEGSGIYANFNHIF